MAIQPVTVPAKGDDQEWKREVQRVLDALIADLAAARTEIDYLKGRVR